MIAIIDGHSDEKIVSKIAIHAGEVILARFEGHEALDPQGKIVDATARIMSLCNAGQILCSEHVKDRLNHEVTFSERHHREAKGIKNGVNVFEILQIFKNINDRKLLIMMTWIILRYRDYLSRGLKKS